MNRKQRRMQAAQQKSASGTSAPAGGTLLAKHLESAIHLRNQGLLTDSHEAFERAVGLDPAHPLVLSEFAHLQRLLDQPSQAAMNLRKALRASPNNPEILANLAVTLRDLDQLDECARAFRKAVELRPGYFQVHGELGTTLQMMGDPQAAIAAFKTSLELENRQPAVHANLGFASLQIGDAASALEACDRCFELDPHSIAAIVVKSYALDELGRGEEAAALMGLDRLIQVIPVDEVPGYASVDEFNAALAKHVTGHSSLAFEPNQRTTKLGQQTGELLRGEKGPMADLEKVLAKSVRRYLEEIPREDDHPFLSYRPQKWHLSAWGTILGRQGHQAPHIHPVAWVSGVYYVQLPDEVKQAGDDQAGWIEFGQAPDVFPLKQACRTRRLEPRESSVVLFPSYLYHRTIPFDSDTPRISIAMDAVRDR